MVLPLHCYCFSLLAISPGMAVLQQSNPAPYRSQKLPSHFLQLYFLPAGDHSLANDSSLAPTAWRSSNTGQPSAQTRSGITDCLALQGKKLRRYRKHLKEGQIMRADMQSRYKGESPSSVHCVLI